jgi:5'-deoxynucleotidase YfbR-like HD superfamily hydrolase
LSREKENDARLANARKSLDQATARSQKMREQYEEKAKRSRLEIKRLTKQVENAKTETENAVRAAEEKHAAFLATALEDAARAFAKREADLRKKLETRRGEHRGGFRGDA